MWYSDAHDPEVHVHTMYIMCVYECTPIKCIYMWKYAIFFISTWLGICASSTQNGIDQLIPVFKDQSHIYFVSVCIIYIYRPFFRLMWLILFLSCSFICITESCADMPEEHKFFM